MNQEPSLKLAMRTAKSISLPVIADHSPVRFLKLGPNSEHIHTTRIRQIKSDLQLTTSELVAELNDFERLIARENLLADGAAKFSKMSVLKMGAYLQGNVLQESFMSDVRNRLEKLYEYKASHKSSIDISSGIKNVMDGWFKTLGIDPKSTVVSPYRQLAFYIAPFYKRPLSNSIAGRFNLSSLIGDSLREFTVTDAKDVIHAFLLNNNEPVLFRHGELVEVRDVIQYSAVLHQYENGAIVAKNEKGIAFSTLYRWYTFSDMKRSIQTLERVQEAVKEAARHQLLEA